MKPDLFNARSELREIFARQREERRPFTPIQQFGLPLNEYLKDAKNNGGGPPG